MSFGSFSNSYNKITFERQNKTALVTQGGN